jgi:death on curing protein
VGGVDAYPDTLLKCSALLHSLTLNHALVDGNKRLALAGSIVFLGVNGVRLTASNDEAYELIMDVASNRLRDVADIHARLTTLTTTW